MSVSGNRKSYYRRLGVVNIVALLTNRHLHIYFFLLNLVCHFQLYIEFLASKGLCFAESFALCNGCLSFFSCKRKKRVE